MANKLNFYDYLHGHCDEWALENSKPGDKFFVITDYDWDIEDYALLHCGIYRNKKFIDIRGSFNNVDMLLNDEFDYGEEMEIQILTLKQFKNFCKNNNLVEQQMNRNLKRDLYNNIMKNVSLAVKQQINENFNTKDNLQSIYENIGRLLLYSNELNESISDKLSSAIDNLKDKADKIKSAGKLFVNNMSDACKNAIENIKKEAGKAWDKIKDTYISLISIIDKALQNSSGLISTLKQQYNIKATLAESYLATGYFDLLSSNLPVVPLVVDYIVNMPKTNTQMLAMNMLLIAIPLISSHCHMDLTSVTDVIKTMKYIKTTAGNEVSASM